jgi:hypothetical protein
MFRAAQRPPESLPTLGIRDYIKHLVLVTRVVGYGVLRIIITAYQGLMNAWAVIINIRAQKAVAS